MKKLILTFLIILFTLTSNVVWSADFNKGSDAFKSGDYTTALYEWRPLAEQGNARAQYNQGLLYENGYGVLQDNIYAHMWGNISAFNGYKKGGNLRERVAKKMTSAEISIAQKLASECESKKYKDCLLNHQCEVELTHSSKKTPL